MIEAWREAADDLGLDIEAPYTIELGQEQIEALLLVRGFGAVEGTLILSLDLVPPRDFVELSARLRERGYFASSLNPRAYVPYSRDR